MLRNDARLSRGGNVGERSFDDSPQNTHSYYETMRDCNDCTFISAAFRVGNTRRGVNYNGLATAPDVK